MHVAFIVLLVGILLAAVVWFAALGILQHRRTRMLARKAHQLGLRFSDQDPFDVPRRYADFAIVGCGHSPRAHNVTYGRLDGLVVRAFDFRYEIGHGTRRAARHYNVAVLEADVALPAILMWNDVDAEYAPIALRQGQGRIACWSVLGDESAAAQLGYACNVQADYGISMQTVDRALMLYVPASRQRRGYSELLAMAPAALKSLSPARPKHQADDA